MGKLDGKVAVITGGSSGMALASAQRFVEEGAYVFITGRKQEALDEAVKLIGRNVTGVRGHGRSRPTGRDYRAAFRRDLRPEYARHAVYGPEGAAAVQRRRIDLHDRVGCFDQRFSRL
jgi:NAD(P)-dependent dehydrogenase (short-subunit alcohol dehydrogenase family)